MTTTRNYQSVEIPIRVTCEFLQGNSPEMFAEIITGMLDRSSKIEMINITHRICVVVEFANQTTSTWKCGKDIPGHPNIRYVIDMQNRLTAVRLPAKWSDDLQTLTVSGIGELLDIVRGIAERNNCDVGLN